VSSKYDEVAERFTEQEYGDPRRYFSHRARLVVSLGPRLEPGDEVLDLACADAGLAEPLLDRGLRYTGVDASGAMVAVARRRLGLDLRCARLGLPLRFGLRRAVHRRAALADVRLIDRVPVLGGLVRGRRGRALGRPRHGERAADAAQQQPDQEAAEVEPDERVDGRQRAEDAVEEPLAGREPGEGAAEQQHRRDHVRQETGRSEVDLELARVEVGAEEQLQRGQDE